jgi:hypothetical protein
VEIDRMWLRLAHVLSLLLAVAACGPAYQRSRIAQNLDDRLNARLAPYVAADRVSLQRVDDSMRVTLSEQPLFVSGRAELSVDGIGVMTGVMQALVDPRLLHIDITGAPASLQAARVTAVQQYFTEANVPVTIQPAGAAPAAEAAGAAAGGPVIIVTVVASQPASVTRGQPSPGGVSFDGRYEGSIEVTGIVAGGAPRQCAVDPRLSLEVRNNAFSYTQQHPNLVNTAPGLTAEATAPTYNATIAPDGSIKGDSGSFSGTLDGTVTGTHMSGTITGFACYYKFSADRV